MIHQHPTAQQKILFHLGYRPCTHAAGSVKSWIMIKYVQKHPNYITTITRAKKVFFGSVSYSCYRNGIFSQARVWPKFFFMDGITELAGASPIICSDIV